MEYISKPLRVADISGGGRYGQAVASRDLLFVALDPFSHRAGDEFHHVEIIRRQMVQAADDVADQDVGFKL